MEILFLSESSCFVELSSAKTSVDFRLRTNMVAAITESNDRDCFKEIMRNLH